MIQSELFQTSHHYPLVCEWWKKSGWLPLPVEHLPEIGIVVYTDDTPACAGFIYQTDSAFCWFDFVVANPKVRRQKRSDCLSFLIKESKRIAEQMGFKTIIHSVKHPVLISRLEKEGFVSTEKNMTNLTFNIQGGI